MARKVRGLERLRRQLRALPNSVRVALADEMRAGAQQMATAIRSAAPEDDGDLKRSIDWSQGPPPAVQATGAIRIKSADLSAAGTALSDAGLLFSVFAGDDKAFYARWVEFGTEARGPGKYRDRNFKLRDGGLKGHAATPAQPFFYPIVLGMRPVMNRRIRTAGRKAAKAIAALR